MKKLFILLNYIPISNLCKQLVNCFCLIYVIITDINQTNKIRKLVLVPELLGSGVMWHFSFYIISSLSWLNLSLSVRLFPHIELSQECHYPFLNNWYAEKLWKIIHYNWKTLFIQLSARRTDMQTYCRTDSRIETNRNGTT